MCAQNSVSFLVPKSYHIHDLLLSYSTWMEQVALTTGQMVSDPNKNNSVYFCAPAGHVFVCRQAESLGPLIVSDALLLVCNAF